MSALSGQTLTRVFRRPKSSMFHDTRTPIPPLVIPRPSSLAHPPGNQKYTRHISKKKNRDQAHDSEVASGARQAEALRGSSALIRH